MVAMGAGFTSYDMSLTQCAACFHDGHVARGALLAATMWSVADALCTASPVGGLSGSGAAEMVAHNAFEAIVMHTLLKGSNRVVCKSE
jgi:hypothetical protein